MKYIDVSEWQSIIEWENVRPHIDGAILRAGLGSKGKADKFFERNVSECNRLGIPCGAYWFSYAKSVDEAKAEARHLLAAVKPYRMDLPLCFDFEYDSVDNAQTQGVKITKELVTSFAIAFLSEIESSGYWALNYTNSDFLTRLYDMDKLVRYGLWLAAWKLSAGTDFSEPPRPCSMWQWGKSFVPGISGAVDCNEAYIDFPVAIHKAGLNHLPTSYPVQDSLKWAQSYSITDDPVLALAFWRYHNTFHAPEDGFSIGTKG